MYLRSELCGKELGQRVIACRLLAATVITVRLTTISAIYSKAKNLICPVY
jgi:hypothetical protein